MIRSASRVVLLSILLAQFSTLAQTTRELAQNAFPSVVLLVMQDKSGQPTSLGSGFFIAPGVIATNLHVIRGAVSGQVKRIGKQDMLPISGVIGIDASNDLVLLKVQDTASPPLTLSKSADLAVGDPVYAVGNPEGLEGTFSQGIVSGFRNIESNKYIQITAPISPGSSGGPIINAKGEVVGVAVATLEEGQNLNFAIPVSFVVPLLADIKPVQPLASVPELQKAVGSPTSTASTAPKRLYIEERIKTTTGTHVNCDAYGNCYGHTTTHTRNVSLEVTKEMTKHCPVVTVTDNVQTADYVLRISPGDSTLYNQHGDVAYISPTRFRVSNLVKDVCGYIQAH